MRSSTESSWGRDVVALAAAFVVALCIAAMAMVGVGVGAAAHDGAERSGRSEVTSAGEANPGVGRSSATGFATPVPGTYSLPPMGDAADGDVVTSEGESVRLHDLFGPDAVLLSFVYTHCNDTEGCPLATAVLHAVGSRLARESEIHPRLRLVSLSFDPERDTPEVMRAYGEGFASKELDWRFLTTTSESTLAPLLEAYRQTRVAEIDAAGRPTGQYSHLLRVFLIDGQGAIRQIYSTAFLEPDALVADIRTILLEADSGGTPRDVAAIEPDADLLARIHPPPLGLPALPIPADNALTAEKVALGRRLFFERRLSHNGTLSCAMCHIPDQGFANNEMATAIGIEGRSVRRNAPTIYNSAYSQHLFHDGREARLEEQVWGPLLARNEMGNPSIHGVLEKVRQIEGMPEAFEVAFPAQGLTMSTLGMALASYERVLISGDSPFDRHLFAGDARALSPAALRGFALFSGPGGCTGCHSVAAGHALLTDDEFHNTGIGYRAAMGVGTYDKQRVRAAPGVELEVSRSIVEDVSEPAVSDLGRAEITGDAADNWQYRTPSLRNVALTAPYMHDGSLATLWEVVEFYRDGGIPNPGLDPRVRPLELTETEVDDLVAFLESLTGSDVELLVDDARAVAVGDPGARGGASSR